MHRYDTFDLVRLRGQATQDYLFEHQQSRELSMVNSIQYGEEIVPSTAYVHALMFPYDGVAAATLLILSDHHSVHENGNEAVRTTFRS